MKECSKETKIYYKYLKIIAKDHSNLSVIINNTDISGYFNLLMNDMNTKNFTKLILKESDHDELGIIRKYMMHLITNSDIIHDAGYLAYNNEFEFLRVFNKMIMSLDIAFVKNKCIEFIIQVMEIINSNPKEAIALIVFF